MWTDSTNISMSRTKRIILVQLFMNEISSDLVVNIVYFCLIVNDINNKFHEIS